MRLRSLGLLGCVANGVGGMGEGVVMRCQVEGGKEFEGCLGGVSWFVWGGRSVVI